MMSAEKFGRRKAEVQEMLEIRERLALVRNKVKSEEHSRDTRGIERRDRIENVLARPNKLRENV